MAKVLVVDDEAPIREVLALTLRAEGYDVVEAAEGAEALHVADLERPDVILLDLKMPGMDGPEFARRYKGRPGGTASIIVITAAQHGEQQAADVDLCAYLAKPFDLDTLVSMVRECAPAPAAAPKARLEPAGP